MSHEIDFTKGRAAFASYQKAGWHKLGNVLTEQPSSIKEIVEQGGLDYEVFKAPNKHVFPDGSEVVSEDSFFTYRKDKVSAEFVDYDKYKVLGAHVGSQYTILQNEDALSIIEPLLDDNRIQFETAGALFEGRRTFLSCKLRNPLVVDSKDVVENYFSIFNSHDGSLSLMALNTPIRTVCWNTMQMALSSMTKQIKIRHTTNAKNRLAEATKILIQTQQNGKLFVEAARQMKKTNWRQSQFFDYLANVFCTKQEMTAMSSGTHPFDALSTRKRNVITAVLDYAHGGVGQKEANPGSAWWAYSAITGYYANVKTYKSEEIKQDRLLFGSADVVMTKALKLAQPETKLFNLGVNLN